MLPKYPIYVISKGRWESRQTHKALTKIGAPHRVVIEPQEFEDYASVIDESMLLVLPFSNLGQGSIPARNWVWEHSIEEGWDRHWILDDNISEFFRLHHNRKYHMDSCHCFPVIEEFVDRYQNVGLAGMQYEHFIPRKEKHPYPLNFNTRIYSNLLIDNSLSIRWRGRYNEDTDLSIRVLKLGLVTCLFNAFLADKTTTMLMKGGNTDELYADDGRYQMALSLVCHFYRFHPWMILKSPPYTKQCGRLKRFLLLLQFKRI